MGFTERMNEYAKRSKEHKRTLFETIKNEDLKEYTFKPRLECRSSQPRPFIDFLKSQEIFLKKKEDLTLRKREDQNPKINENSATLASKRYGNASVYNRLYEKTKDKNTSKPIQQTNKKTQTKNTDYMLAKGFKREFTKAINILGLNDAVNIQYKSVKRILKEMHFINNLYFCAPKDELSILVNKLWNTIKIPKENTVPKSRLELYIAAILDISMPHCELSLSEQREIRKIFKAFYLNRKASKRVYECKIEELSFRPSLCKESLRLIENRYSSVKIKLEDKEESDINSNKNSFDMDSNKKENVSVNSKSSNEKSKKVKNNRCNILYNLSKTKKKALDTNEKEDKECTFHPNTKKGKVDTTPVKVDKATLDLAIERMRRGRKERERVQNALSRGNTIKPDFKYSKYLTKDRKHNSCKDILKRSNEFSDEEEPLLYIDVNLEGQQKRIVVYKSDKASDLAEQFIKDNGKLKDESRFGYKFEG